MTADLAAIAAALRNLNAAAKTASILISKRVALGPGAGHDTYAALHAMELALGEFRHSMGVAMSRLPEPLPAPQPEPEPAKAVAEIADDRQTAKAARRAR